MESGKMTLRAFCNLGWKFLSLKPTLGQIVNTTKYSYRFFSDSFKPRVNHDPLSIGVHLTYNCNLKCKYCWNPTINKKEFRDKNMTVEDIRDIVTHPRLRNAVRVSFVGGEPLMHPLIFEFIEICRENKKLTMFPSNGLLITKRLDEFKKTSLTAIQVSLYDGNIEKQLENVRLLREANQNIEIELARYVTKERESLEYFKKVVEYAREAKVNKICFQNFQPKDREDAYLAIYDDDTEVIEHIAELKRKYGKGLNIMLPAPLKRNTAERFCYDLYTTIFVGKGGDIAPCSSIVPPKKQFGNVFDEDFWNNKYFSKHREFYNSKFPFHPVCEFCYESSKHVRNFI